MTDLALGKREIQEISEEYGLGKVTSVEPAPSGWIRPSSQQQNFLVEAGKGRYIFRFDGGRGELDIKREVDLLLYLRKHSFPCPQPVPDRKSRHYRSFGGTCLIAFKHIEGQPEPVPELSQSQIEAIGRGLSELHVVGKGYKKGIDNRFSFERVAELYAGVRTGLPPYFRKIARTLDEEVDYLGNYLEGKLPKGVINGDLFDENFLLQGDKFVGMLDFDAACRGKFIFDLATAVNAICFRDHSYDLKRFEALIGGYESLRTLSLAEWDAFPNELRFSALRFTITRLHEIVSLPKPEEGLAAITEGRPAHARGAEKGTPVAAARARAVDGFQAFYERLAILRREKDGGMEPMLLAMATGYDYRKYQKVKAVEKKGK